MNAPTLTLGIIVAIIFISGVFYLVRGIKAVLTSQREEQPLLWHQQHRFVHAVRRCRNVSHFPGCSSYLDH
jgi:hypothetical protein